MDKITSSNISSNLNVAVIGSFLEIIADEKLLFSADAMKLIF